MARLEIEVDRLPPDGFILDKVVVIVEGIDPVDGRTTLWYGRSPEVKTWQSIGMLDAVLRTTERYIVDEFVQDPGSSDD